MVEVLFSVAHVAISRFSTLNIFEIILTGCELLEDRFMNTRM